MNINMRFRRSRRAFTLIEILVVILILSILAALIIPRLIGRTSDAKIASATNDISPIEGLLEMYRVDNDKFSSTEQGLDALRNAPSNVPLWKGPYVTKPIPNDPW